MTDLNFIRNFAIIAHIDHGKSTLADRLIEYCGAVNEREMKSQILDSMDLERERGITIKAQAIRLKYEFENTTYIFNLIDTPGHVDFSYEVSRSLSACEGVLLVVDSTQGVEAQTLANTILAVEADLEIIPVLNKTDLPSADIKRVSEQIEDLIGIDSSASIECSAKTGVGIRDLITAIITRLPPPSGQIGKTTKALLVDSWYDPYLGIMVLVRVMDGYLFKGQKIKMMGSNVVYTLEQVGILSPKPIAKEKLGPGEVGFITAGIKEVADTNVGDTITDAISPTKSPLPGFKPSIPVVFCGLYPVYANDYDNLRVSLPKLRLNDSSMQFEAESSSALGLGFRCGFLGLLHLEIVQERLEREYGLDLITTAPSVVYEVIFSNGNMAKIHNPAEWPDPSKVSEVKEPWIRASIFTPDEYLGGILKLCTEKRGEQIDISFVGTRALVVYDLPLNEIVFDFYDRLKSVSKGYASLDYEIRNSRTADLVKVSMLVNGESVESLSFISHRSIAESRGRAICQKLKGLIPRQLFKVAIQAAIGGKVIARETVSALRKDVTAKCYGGDITRKKKLLEKQKKGKKRMRQVGNVEIPQEAFLAALKID